MHARGDLVFQIDVDLEEEPEMLEAFYQELIKTQADVVYGVQDKRKGGFFEKVFGGLFYRFFNFLSDVNMPPNLLMARLMTPPLDLGWALVDHWLQSGAVHCSQTQQRQDHL